jgi:hypothetical protein
MHFERDVYIQQVLLFFRRHGLSGYLDSLEQLWAYRVSPHMILRPNGTFLSDMQELSIFSKLCSRTWIRIPSIYC